MDALVVTVLLAMEMIGAAAPGYTGAVRLFCDQSKVPLEVGEWTRGLAHLDTVAVENPPVTMSEGQVYVYENYFPNQTIKYIQVDNLAKRSCGASASIKAGGYNSNGVLIVLQAEAHQEIRTVIDIWGMRAPPPARHRLTLTPEQLNEMKQLKSKYLYSLRALHHNNFKTNPKSYYY